jgi:hypothetical protein
VVVVAVARFGTAARTVRHLRAQTARDRIELVLVAPSAAVLAEADPAALEGFAKVRPVVVGRIDNVDHAVAAGVRHATAPFVALIEDHAFPAPDWGARVIDAHATPADAVGPAIVNANPRSLLSWTNYLLAYGAWAGGALPGPVADVPGHNSSFRTSLLQAFGDSLGTLLQRDGGLMDALRREGATFVHEPRARVAHVNPSTWRATSALRFRAGRAYGAARAVRERWSLGRRLAFAAAGPLIPLVRLPRELRTLRTGGSSAGSPAMTLGALAIGLLLDAAGQMAGYCAGPGHTADWLATFEMDRLQHITRADRPLLSDSP